MPEQEGSPTTRVLIVDDHRTFAELLAFALGSQPDFDCAGWAGTGATAVELAARERPDMVVMDISLGAESGLEVTRRIREATPDATVVVVSAHRDPDWVVRAAQAGASAFVPKTGSLEEMLSVLRSVRQGSMLVSASMFGEPPPRPRVTDDPAPVDLTARESEVLTLMGKGLAPAEIARLLGISINTCRGYVKSIHLKLGVRSQLQAVVKAQQLGLVEAHSDG
ncbi:response regulator transcription factor [Streptomyces sp. NPDC002265]|uniref:response regulator transcription factor n=1 Tax=Streptomyces sp. NPDC002265 TaxID=3154415 RepID=UPI00331A8F2D